MYVAEPLAVNVLVPGPHKFKFPVTVGLAAGCPTVTVMEAQLELHWLLLKLLTK